MGMFNDQDLLFANELTQRKAKELNVLIAKNWPTIQKIFTVMVNDVYENGKFNMANYAVVNTLAASIEGYLGFINSGRLSVHEIEPRSLSIEDAIISKEFLLAFCRFIRYYSGVPTKLTRLEFKSLEYTHYGIVMEIQSETDQIYLEIGSDGLLIDVLVAVVTPLQDMESPKANQPDTFEVPAPKRLQ